MANLLNLGLLTLAGLAIGLQWQWQERRTRRDDEERLRKTLDNLRVPGPDFVVRLRG